MRAILLHAFAADRLTWAGTVPALAGVTCETPDLPGHGKSLKHLGDASLAGLAAPISDQLDSGDPAWLIGHSLGGAIALHLAAERPEQVRGLVLMAPLGLGDRLNLEQLAAVAQIDSVETMTAFLQNLVANPGLIVPMFAEYALEQLDRPGARDAMARIATALPAHIDDVTGHIETVRQGDLPVTILWGREDRVVRPDPAKIAPLGELIELDGAGHILHVEAAKAVNTLLKEKLAA